MKKAFTILTAALLFAFFWVAAYAAQPGDVDGNGNVTAADARLALRAAVGLEPEITPDTEAFLAADTDFDEVLTSADARSILRAAVGLEDLHDRLPESEALGLSKIEINLNNAILSIDTYVSEGSLRQCFGFAIDNNGTVVIPYSSIKQAVSFEVDKEGCEVEAVLYTDPVSDLALLKVSGDVPYVPVNRTWYNNGDRVYACDNKKDIHCGRISQIPAGARFRAPAATICTEWDYVNKLYSLTSLPLADRFGRAIGILTKKESVDGKEYVYAVPLSKLPSPQDYDPKTVEEFSREEWHVPLECAVSEVAIMQYGVAIIPIESNNANSNNFTVVNPAPDFLDVSFELIRPTTPILMIVAKQPCRDIPVTLRYNGKYESPEITVRVYVTTEGYVNIPGVPVIPDPGVIWECLPNSFTVHEWSLEFSYKKADTGLSDEDLFYSYVEYLMAMGYEYERIEQKSTYNEYWFRLTDTDFYVVYKDAFSSVHIVGCINLHSDENGYVDASPLF